MLEAKARLKFSNLEFVHSNPPPKLQKNLELSSSPLSNQIDENLCLDQDTYDFNDYGNYLSRADIQEIKKCTKDFVCYQLVNYMGDQINEWERDIASSRRGISARLLKVGLKYFNKSVPTTTTFTDSTGTLIFSADSPEFLMRKLADYSFMLKDYKFAASTYETIKKDFQGSPKFAKYLAGVQVNR